MRAKFVVDLARVINQLQIIADGENANLLGREPKREVASVVLDEESDETLV